VLVSALEELIELKGTFGRAAAHRAAEVLDRLRRTRIRDPQELIRLHEAALFFRAYPHSPRVLRLADELLFDFGSRLRGIDLDAFEDPEISGIAGTSVSTNFSYTFARSLADRHGSALQIDWDNFPRADRMGAVLSKLIPASAEEWMVEPHVDWRKWFKSARGNVKWLLDRVDPQTYDLLEIPLRWNLGDSTATRSRTRIPRRDIFFHKGPLLKRSDVSIVGELASPRIQVKRLSRAQAQRILNVIIDTSAVRYRELWGFQHPDAAHVDHADLGRGVDLFFFGVPREWRLPVRAYHGGVFFKNGVPMGYIEGLSLFERMEVGFNLYYTFREGETAWLYARLLKFCRQRLGVTCFSIDPYQLGHENDEAIASGAFWFYRKLGFQPSTDEALRLTLREEERIAAQPGYRTPPAILRRLARSPLFYGCSDDWSRLIMPRGALTGDVLRAKNASEESRYLRLLQRSSALRRAVLRRSHSASESRFASLG
jgi:hypothetical protein